MVLGVLSGEESDTPQYERDKVPLRSIIDVCLGPGVVNMSLVVPSPKPWLRRVLTECLSDIVDNISHLWFHYLMS